VRQERLEAVVGLFLWSTGRSTHWRAHAGADLAVVARRSQDDLFKLFSQYGNVTDTFIATGELRDDGSAVAWLGALPRRPVLPGFLRT
jgi:hypothetical protein